MPRTATYPIYENQSGWNALLPKRQPAVGRPAEAAYDFVIIGAGYTGLAAARRLAELNPGKQVLVLESSEVGEGSSARNSGFIISLPHNTKLSGHTGPTEVMRKQTRVYEAGVRWLQDIVQTHGIDCAWNVAGKYHGAATRHGEAGLRAAAAHYKDCAIECQELSGTELAAVTGSHYYRYGIRTGHNIFIQPAAFVRGLADTLPPNVELREDNPVSEIRGKGPYDVYIPGGQVRAGKLVLANNGFAKRLGFARDRLVIIFTYAGMTPEMDDEHLALHGAGVEWGLIPANRLGTTLRKIQNRRFMVRSAYSYETAQPMEKVRAMLTDYYRRRYPALESHEFEYVWGGVTALTRNGAAYFGPVGKDIYASLGCNGAGVLKGSIYGKLLAEMIMGEQSQELSDVQSLGEPNWMPPEPFRRAAVITAIHYEEHRAGLER
ncbi:NAD(P)/FAD-dependent oxidoreductase [Castellaniella sp. UC4442_H9]